MTTEHQLPGAARPQSLRSRLLWFGVGGVIGYALNAGPFYLIEQHLAWPRWLAYAASLTFQTVIFFLWNYFINFRTPASWGPCAGRYIATVLVFYASNYALAQLGFWVMPEWRYAVIAVVPAMLAGIKFGLYHWWVFPKGDG